MKKIAINTVYGGFYLPDELTQRYTEITGKTMNNYGYDESIMDFIDRSDETLIFLIENEFQDLSVKVVEIPDDVDWCIKDYDGIEWVAEKHRTWSWSRSR